MNALSGETLARLAPCGLDCGRCLNNPQSPIATLAVRLREELGGFGARAAFFAALEPVFEKYQDFETVLDRLASGECSGCRTGKCLLGECRPQSCVKERGVNFCFECSSFPCQESGLEGGLKARWEKNNRMMREMGVEAYLVMTLEKPRY